jgi:hypothetical protein
MHRTNRQRSNPLMLTRRSLLRTAALAPLVVPVRSLARGVAKGGSPTIITDPCGSPTLISDWRDIKGPGCYSCKTP